MMIDQAPSGPADTRILLVDDHAVVREALAALLARQEGFSLVGQCGTGLAGVDLHARFQPDVTLMDINLPDISGLQAIREIRSSFPQARILVISTYADFGRILAARHIGARGFLAKTADSAELFAAVRTIAAGATSFPAGAARPSLPSPRSLLNVRELRVIERMARGESNPLIARELSISVDTVKSRIQVIFRKLEAHSRTDAVVRALELGLIRTQHELSGQGGKT